MERLPDAIRNCPDLDLKRKSIQAWISGNESERQAAVRNCILLLEEKKDEGKREKHKIELEKWRTWLHDHFV